MCRTRKDGIMPVFVLKPTANPPHGLPSENRKWMVLTPECSDLSYLNTDWMNDPRFGPECVVPGIDILGDDCITEFDTYDEALTAVARKYAEQLPAEVLREILSEKVRKNCNCVICSRNEKAKD